MPFFSVINIKQATWKGNEGVNAVSTSKAQPITKRQAGIQTKPGGMLAHSGLYLSSFIKSTAQGMEMPTVDWAHL